MGRCQGGFCMPRVLEILSRELGVSVSDIEKGKKGSWLVAGNVKGENI
jgi:glycerol-3-phosphate dehydrogenase